MRFASTGRRVTVAQAGSRILYGLCLQACKASGFEVIAPGQGLTMSWSPPKDTAHEAPSQNNGEQVNSMFGSSLCYVNALPLQSLGRCLCSWKPSWRSARTRLQHRATHARSTSESCNTILSTMPHAVTLGIPSFEFQNKAIPLSCAQPPCKNSD